MSLTSIASNSRRSIPLQDLLTECFELVTQACNIIREVQLERDRNDDGVFLQTELKDPADPRSYLTVADKRAQHHIVIGLRERFGVSLDIVGEEDDDIKDVSLRHSQSGGASGTQVCGLNSTYIFPDAYKNLDLADVCVFVDPLDGTR